jgi:hypothetical protein
MRGLASVTFEGIPRFDVEEAIVDVSTTPDLTGMPVLQSLKTVVHFTINANDQENIPFASIQKLFDLSNVPEENKIKNCKVEFWKNDKKQDVIASYSFKGWISHFRTSNTGIENSNKSYNHLIHVTVIPVINKALHSELRIGN